MKKLLSILLLGGGIFAFTKFSKLKDLKSSLEFIIDSRIHAIKFGNLDLATDIKIDNPKTESVEIKNPVIRIYTPKKNLLLTKHLDDINISANQITEVNDIHFEIPYLNAEILNIIKNAGKNVLEIPGQFARGEDLNLGVELTMKFYGKVMGQEFEQTIPLKF